MDHGNPKCCKRAAVACHIDSEWAMVMLMHEPRLPFVGGGETAGASAGYPGDPEYPQIPSNPNAPQ